VCSERVARNQARGLFFGSPRRREGETPRRLSSPIKADENASNQKRASKHGTDEIEVVTGTVWQAPPHAWKPVERFGDVGKDHDQQTSEAQ